MTVDEDGEFWMPWEEFVKYFTDVSVCQLFNTGCSTASGVFNEYIFFDEWSTNGVKCGAPKDRAGGCQNFSATFCFNPQYRFDVYQPGSEMMIALTQKEIQNEAAKQKEPYVTIGIHVMKVETNRRHRIHQVFHPLLGRVIILKTFAGDKSHRNFGLRLRSIRVPSLNRHRPGTVHPDAHHLRPEGAGGVHAEDLFIPRLQSQVASSRLPETQPVYVYKNKCRHSPENCRSNLP